MAAPKKKSAATIEISFDTHAALRSTERIRQKYLETINMLKRTRRDNGNVKMSRNQSHNVMSSKTKDFLQKICYKKTASIDMTHYGFISDSKVSPVNLLLRPLREQLVKICGNSNKSTPKKGTPVKRSEKGLKRLPKALEMKKLKLKKKEATKKVKKVQSKPVTARKKRFPLLNKNPNSPA